MSSKTRIIYFDGMMDAETGTTFFSGVQSALDSSSLARDFELVAVRFNYGPKSYSPRLMAELARDHDAAGIILSGSEKNTSEPQDAWVKDYYYGLERLLADDLDRPVFGICFGHQAIACLFGGETSRFSYRSGFIDISMAHQGAHHPALTPFNKLRLGVTHGDHVVRLPSGFQLLATSDYCDCQALAHDTRPILSVQSHPELTKKIRDVITEKKDWAEVSDQEFESQDGPALLHSVFSWMASHSS